MSKKVFKESITVLKALKATDIELNEIQIYLSTNEGAILEFNIGYDEDGEICKTMDAQDSMEELEEAREDQENEMTENVLLN